MRMFGPIVLILGALSCTGQIGTGGGIPGNDLPIAAGREFLCTDSLADPGPSIVRRHTLLEYINTVRDSLGVDIRSEATALHPKDLRADGFSNTSSALVVTLDHVQSYESLAKAVVSKIELSNFIAEHTSCTDFEAECMTEFITRAGGRVFRGVVADTDIAALQPIFGIAQTENITFQEAAGLILEAMLQSPRFLYRIENQRGDGSYSELDGYELANRLSYLIWSSGPDEQLLSAARNNELHTSEEISAQVQRMLDDPRARETSILYLTDWLNLNRLDHLSRDPEVFPSWDPQLGSDMKTETIALFEHLVWEENKPLTEIFRTQRSFLSQRLAEHYGLTDVQDGNTWYDLSDVDERGGLLTHGSILSIGGDEASMVSRGLFILDTILCGEVSSPPPGTDTIPQVPMPGASNRVLSEERVANPECGGCHSQMEPHVWGLERFDATGAFSLIDTHGNKLEEDGYIVFPGSKETNEYSTVSELMELFAHSDRIRDCMALKANQFAIGRLLIKSDGCSLVPMREHFVSHGATYQALIEAIALSPMLRTLRTE